jgi:hypothetical protein
MTSIFHQRLLRTAVLVLTHMTLAVSVPTHFMSSGLSVSIPHIYRRDNDDRSQNADDFATQNISMLTASVSTKYY